MISPEQLKAEEGGLWVGDTSVGRGLGYMSQNSLPRGFQLGEATGGIFLWYLKGRGEGATTVMCLCSAVWAGTCAATRGWLWARAGSANAPSSPAAPSASWLQDGCVFSSGTKDITLPTKVCLVKAVVFPGVMYGCESWTINKAECWKIDAFGLWCCRRLLRVAWTARRSNQLNGSMKTYKTC